MNTPAIKTTRAAALLAALAATLPLHAATVSWDGGSNPATANWSGVNNWSTNALPQNGDDLIFNNSTSMNAASGGRTVQYDAGDGLILNSISSNINSFRIRLHGSTRSLILGGNDTFGSAHITLTGNASIANVETFTTAGTEVGRRLNLRTAHELTLKGTGAGEYRFVRAALSNTAGSTGIDTLYFAGSGNWGFEGDSYASSAIEKTSVNATLDLELKSGADAFTGTLRYATTNALNVDNVRVNSGTLRLENATLTTTGNSAATGLTVGANGTFGGSGTVNGSATIAGRLDVGAPAANGLLTFHHGLTLQAGSETRLDIAGLASFDRIALAGGTLARDGALLLTLTGTYAEGDSWALFTGLDGSTGSFSSVVLNGEALGQSGNLWSGTYGGHGIEFDQATGLLSITSAIPEPSTAALLLGLAALGATTARRRRAV